MSATSFGIPGVISQRNYPGAGDIDDCWVVATVWAAVASRPGINRPTVPQFRHAAGIPDIQGKPNGGDIEAVGRGARGVWDIPVTVYNAHGWSGFLGLVKEGMPASVALDSGDLPATHRYNFTGNHQVGIVWDGSTLRIANPLAPSGSKPKPITDAQLLKACRSLVASGKIHALMFPVPTEDRWGSDVSPDMQLAYSAYAVGSKLRSLGIDEWGTNINRVDLERGLRKRGIAFGTSVQLPDLRALMKAGKGEA